VLRLINTPGLPPPQLRLDAAILYHVAHELRLPLLVTP
jgi:hypothetical protein